MQPSIAAATLSGYPPLLAHILDGKHYDPMLRSTDVAQHRAEWRALRLDRLDAPG